MAFILSGVPVNANAQAPSEPRNAPPLSLDDVVQLVKSQVSEEIVVTRIKKNARPFDLSTQELLELKRDGISETILKYLLDPSLPYTPAPAPVPTNAPKVENKYPDDTFAAKVPADPGMYLMRSTDSTKLELKVMVASNSAGKGGKLSGGLLKGKPIGLLLGSKAKVRVTGAMLVFHLRLPPGGNIEEISLLALSSKENNRELELTPAKGKAAKPAPKVESMRQFEAVEVGPVLYRIGISKLSKGEYFFYLIGSPDPQKGIQGKGYDFGVD